MLLFESARVVPTFGIERENRVRGSNDAHRFAGHKAGASRAAVVQRANWRSRYTPDAIPRPSTGFRVLTGRRRRPLPPVAEIGNGQHNALTRMDEHLAACRRLDALAAVGERLENARLAGSRG